MNLSNDYYGDSIRWFVARVIDNKDPTRSGRVKIRVFGVHSPYTDELPDYVLPWAQTLLPTTEGGTSGIGKIPQLLPNALVFGIFLDGKTSQLPLVLGHLNHVEMPTPVQIAAGPISTLIDTYQTSRVATPNGTIVDATVTAANTNSNVTARRMAAMKFFVDQFKNPTIAAGIVGNLQAESAFSTSAVGDVNRGGSYGIAQWNAEVGRYQALQRYASSINKSWSDFDVQLMFVMEELTGGPYALRGPMNCYNVLKQCTSYEGGPVQSNATWIFLSKYEIPADMQSKLPTRESYAREAYRQFNGT